MKKDFVMPILVLSLICLVISGALAFTNGITEPVIQDAAAKREEEAMQNIIKGAGDQGQGNSGDPGPDEFVPLSVEGLPETIKEAYRSPRNAGYVFTIVAPGYGGDIRMICAITLDGGLIQHQILEHSETKGIGAKISEPPFMDRFGGIDSLAGFDGVDTISGATISSTACINALKDAYTAFEIIEGVQK